MTIQGALDWINAKGEDFGRAHQRIIVGRERAAKYARAQPQGSEARARAGETVNRWSEMLGDQQRTMARWANLTARIPGLDGNLGIVPVIPVALAGTVIAIAVAMALLLRKLTAEERALALLESGRINVAEALELVSNIEGGRPPLLGGVGGIVPLAAAGAVAYFLMRR